VATTTLDDEPRYEAFISYSHADARWASWLHRAIETYRVPKRLIAERPDLPARLTPVFRDREELPSAVDLGQKIETALRGSKRLIVVCSPRAAASQWVNEEIRRFKALGRGDRIFSIIVEGEPNAIERGKDPSLECFPEQLRKGASGAQHDPIAADVRPEGDGRRNAQFKLIAGMLGVGLDDLKRREAQRRQRRLVAITVASVAGLIVTSALAAFALVARRDAQREAQTSRRTTEFMVQLFDVVDPGEARGRSVTAYEILEKGVGQIHQLNDAPEVQATLLQTMGKVFTGLGLYERSIDLLRESLDTKGAPADSVSTQVALGDALYLHGDYDAAEERYRNVLSALSQQPWSDDRSNASNGLADVLTQKGDYEQATALYRDTLQRDVATWGSANVHGARTSNGLATALLYAGDTHGAELSYQRALDAYRAALGPDHPKVAEAINNLGAARFFGGDNVGAAEYWRSALPMYRKLYGDVHPEVSMILNNLGRAELESRSIQDAVPLLEESVAIDRKLGRSEHDDFVFALNSLALAYRERGDLAGAQRLLSEALALAQRTEHRMWGPILVNQTDLKCSQGDAEGSAATLDEAAMHIHKAYPDEPWRIAILDSVRGQCLCVSGQPVAGEALLVESLPIIDARWGKGSLFAHDARARLAAHYERAGDPKTAATYRDN
jgi:tetratricopeptide (TPR) repeat protein